MTLLKALDSLRLEDGQPDKLKRRLHSIIRPSQLTIRYSTCRLSELVTVLSIDEVRHLRVKLESRLRNNGNLIFQQLPMDIFLLIASYLDIEDLIRMKIVSRSWNQTFSDKEFCLQMIRKHFLSTWNHQIKDLKLDNAREGPIYDPTVWLRRAIINRVRRERGFSSNMTRYDFRWNHPKPTLKYCNGRIAFQKDGIFDVRNLRTQDRSTFTTPNRETIYSWILSDQFLIGLMHAPTKLFAWKLSCEEEHFYSVLLPSNPFSFSAYHDQVGIVSATFELLIWSVGGQLKILQTAKPKKAVAKEKIFVADIFFHAIDPDRCFFIYHSRAQSGPGTTYLNRITVQSFLKSKINKVLPTEFTTNFLPSRQRNCLISNDGLIGIEVQDHMERAQDGSYKLITFDMNNEQFKHHELHLHQSVKNSLNNGYNFIWRNQIYHPMFRVEDRRGFQIEVIMIQKQLLDIWECRYEDTCGLGTEHSGLLRGEPSSSSIHTEIESERPVRERRIWGDDDYLLLLTEDGLLVWQFDLKVDE